MILTEEQQKEFEEKTKPLIEWLCKNCNPHAKITITQTSAELLDGVSTINTDEFLVD
jgi:hypothetical protein